MARWVGLGAVFRLGVVGTDRDKKGRGPTSTQPDTGRGGVPTLQWAVRPSVGVVLA